MLSAFLCWLFGHKDVLLARAENGDEHSRCERCGCESIKFGTPIVIMPGESVTIGFGTVTRTHDAQGR